MWLRNTHEIVDCTILYPPLLSPSATLIWLSLHAGIAFGARRQMSRTVFQRIILKVKFYHINVCCYFLILRCRGRIILMQFEVSNYVCLSCVQRRQRRFLITDILGSTDQSSWSTLLGDVCGLIYVQFQNLDYDKSLFRLNA